MSIGISSWIFEESTVYIFAYLKASMHDWTGVLFWFYECHSLAACLSDSALVSSIFKSLNAKWTGLFLGDNERIQNIYPSSNIYTNFSQEPIARYSQLRRWRRLSNWLRANGRPIEFDSRNGEWDDLKEEAKNSDYRL